MKIKHREAGGGEMQRAEGQRKEVMERKRDLESFRHEDGTYVNNWARA